MCVAILALTVWYMPRTGSDSFISDALDWFDNGGIHIGVDGRQTADGRDVARKQESGSLYNERGRDELVEIGARYEDRHTSKQGKEAAMGEGSQKGVSHKLDFDEYDDDGGEEEVERKAEAVDDGNDSRRTQRPRNAGGNLGTVAETAEDAAVVLKRAEQKSRSTGEVRMDEGSTNAKDQEAAGADVKLLRTSAVPKPPRTKRRRHPASEYLVARYPYLSVKPRIHQFPRVVIGVRAIGLRVCKCISVFCGTLTWVVW